MTLADNAVPVGLTIADGLREAADWLDSHPELETTYAFVSIQATGRADLEALAAALGDRATERVGYVDTVEISGRFGTDNPYGGVNVCASLPVKVLAGEPVKPKYTPILRDRGES